MKKLIGLLSLTWICSIPLSAQRPFTNPTTDESYLKGKELYEQQKYAEAYRILSEENGDTYTLPIHTEENELLKTFCSFELRHKDAKDQIKDFLLRHPYTPYKSTLLFMQASLITETRRPAAAADLFAKVNKKELSAKHQEDMLFYQAYAQLADGDTTAAMKGFKESMEKKNRYEIASKYYYAYTLYAKRNYDGALPLFLSIEDNPRYDNIIPYYVAQIYFAQGEYDQVNERAQTLLKRFPQSDHNAELHRMLGELSYTQQKYDLAIKHLTTYAKEKREKKEQLQRNNIYMLGLSYYQQKDYANAVKYLTRVTTTSDLMTENAYLHIGNAYLSLNNTEQAKLAFSNAVRTNFDANVHEEAMFNYALSSYKAKDTFGESVNAFVNFITQYPKSKHIGEAYELFGDVLLKTNNHTEAYAALSKVNSNDKKLTAPKHYLLYRMGALSYSGKKWKEAIEYFQQAMQTSPNGKYVTDCLFWEGDCCYRMGQAQHAESNWNRFIKRSDSKNNPNNQIVHYALGYACFSQQNYATALTHFKNYLNTSSKDNKRVADTQNRIGDCYFHDRNFAEAEKQYAKVITSGQPGADYASYQRGCILGLLKKYDDKIITLEKLVKGYPKSDYADDALYEMARAYLMKNDNISAINTYERILAAYPHSDLVRLSALEIGMVQSGLGEHEKAIEAYKKVITLYPGSEESYTALQGIESSYVTLNRISDYLAYTKTLGTIITVPSTNKEDSLTYMAAEHQFIQGNYKEAAKGLETYVERFCPVGRYCTQASYYLATSYYNIDDKTNALAAYDKLTHIANNPYIEEAYTRCAMLSYDLQQYDSARVYFQSLQKIANSTEIIHAARIGTLRCSNKLNDFSTTIDLAGQIIQDTQSDEEMKKEAHYTRAKAYLQQGQPMLATADLQYLASNLQSEMGAEAKYLLADIHYNAGDLVASEEEIMDFASKNTPHQFWLARSLVLLADINMKNGDDFQAKQYLLSLQNNYTASEEINTLVAERLLLIQEREKERIVE